METNEKKLLILSELNFQGEYDVVGVFESPEKVCEVLAEEGRTIIEHTFDENHNEGKIESVIKTLGFPKTFKYEFSTLNKLF